MTANGMSVNPHPVGHHLASLNKGEGGDMTLLLHYVVLVVTSVRQRRVAAMGRRVCAGAMLRRDMAIAAASCLSGDATYGRRQPDPARTAIYIRDGEKPLIPYRIFMYEAGDDFKYALIMVENSDQREFPTLPQKEELQFSKMKDSCLFAGYGDQDRLALANFKVTQLKDVNVDKVNCTGRPKDRLCLTFVEPRTFCRGDVGSPLVCGGRLYGLAVGLPSLTTNDTLQCVEGRRAEFQVVTLELASRIGRMVRAPPSPAVPPPDTTHRFPWYLVVLCCVSLLLIVGCICYCVTVLVPMKPLRRIRRN